MHNISAIFNNEFSDYILASYGVGLVIIAIMAISSVWLLKKSKKDLGSLEYYKNNES